MRKKLIVGIDATRNKSGGAVAHLVALCSNLSTVTVAIEKIHLWGYKKLLDAVPNHPILQKHCPQCTEKSIFHQLLWQRLALHVQAQKHGCHIIFNTDAGTLCQFQPSITLSQDMLSFEHGEMKRYGISSKRLRLELLKIIQLHSLEKSNLALFLTEYAAKSIRRYNSAIINFRIIGHGINECFFKEPEKIDKPRRSTRVVYVSNTAPYKHQWHVVEAIAALRAEGINISLCMIGGGNGPSQERLDRIRRQYDPDSTFTQQLGFLPNSKVRDEISKSDIFLFASSCENMPITLLEGMASGLPIACSDRGPMPEVLQDCGAYFDPEDPISIKMALSKLLESEIRQYSFAQRSFQRSRTFTWERCHKKTWDTILRVATQTTNNEVI